VERRVSRPDIGDAWWPLLVESGTLRCDDGAVTLEVDGTTYAVNATARALGLGEDLDPIWADEDSLHCGLKKSIAPLVSLGLALC